MVGTRVVKESFKKGLLILLPLIISVIVVKFLADQLFKLVNPLVRSTNLAAYTGNIEIIAQVLALSLVLIIITLTGYISGHKVSEKLSKILEKLVKEIPLFGSVYSTVDRISKSISGESEFKKMVLVELPNEENFSIGLVTSEAPQPVKDEIGEGYKSVFMPYSPNPTMGQLKMVKEENLREVDMEVSQGMKLLLTSGMAYKQEEIEELDQEIPDLKQLKDKL